MNFCECLLQPTAFFCLQRTGLCGSSIVVHYIHLHVYRARYGLPSRERGSGAHAPTNRAAREMLIAE